MRKHKGMRNCQCVYLLTLFSTNGIRSQYQSWIIPGTTSTTKNPLQGTLIGLVIRLERAQGNNYCYNLNGFILSWLGIREKMLLFLYLDRVWYADRYAFGWHYFTNILCLKVGNNCFFSSPIYVYFFAFTVAFCLIYLASRVWFQATAFNYHKQKHDWRYVDQSVAGKLVENWIKLSADF